MALGNWGNTPSPPLDPDAPDAVGNDGELVLRLEGERKRLLVQSARLSAGELTIEGERYNRQPEFVITAIVPAQVETVRDLEGSKLAITTGVVFSEMISDGVLEVTRVTGEGPWELDGNLKIEGRLGSLRGELQARVRG